MGKLMKLSCAAIALCVLALTFNAALAATDLGNTSWSSPADGGCSIDIHFKADGTATVFKTELMALHRDTAHWTQQGSEFHLTYDTWGGGLEGGFWNGGNMLGVAVTSIRATETYQDDTGATHARECTFQENK